MKNTMRDLHGKVALVTGAASGIGRSTALALASAGARLVVCDVDDDGLRSIERELAGACLFARRVDVSKRDEMRSLAAAVHERVAALDVLVNNAGVGLSGGMLDTTLDDWEWILSINLWGVIHGCHFFVPQMVGRHQGGHIINVSSALGYFAAPDVIGYSTTKFGVFGLSESLRAELAPHRIGVTAICPGVISTGIIAKTRFRGAGNAEETRAHVNAIYAKRNYGPEKVAKAIIEAIRKDASVVPVSPEAWALYYLKRIAPSLAGPVGRLLAGRTVGEKRARSGI